MKQKKRIIALIMAALLAASVVGTSVAFIPTGTGIVAEAAETTNDGFKYEVNDENNTVTITGYSGQGGDVKIPSKIDNKDVTSIGDKAFYSCTSITSITIPNSVTTIDWNAFYGCSALTNIEIPNSVTSIGAYAFYDCSSLTSITIPNSVTSIDKFTFRGCTGLTSITIPDSVTSIGDYAFYSCTGLNSVSIPDSVTSIGEDAFRACTRLTSIIIPDSVTNIGNSVFSNCTSLTTITIPDSVTSIGINAFYNCEALTTVNYHGTAQDWSNISIGTPNDKLNTATIEYNQHPISEKWSFDENNHYHQCIYCDTVKEDTSEHKWVTTVVNSVITRTCSVCNHTKTEEVECGENLDWSLDEEGKLTISGTGAMTNWSSSSKAPWYSFKDDIKEVVIEDGVTNVGNYAFYQCSSLTSITIPNSVNSIGDYAFNKCTGITIVSIGSGVTSIGKCAFFDCRSLTGIIIPDSVTSIGVSAFTNCAGLTSIEIPNNVTSIGSGAFYNCQSLTSITIGSGVTSIVDGAFQSCTSLASITIPNSVTSIGNSAFYACRSLTSITIPDSVTSIGNSAFRYCDKLTSITIGSGVTSIGEYAFYNCTALKTVNYHGTEQDWGKISSIGENNDPLNKATREYLGHPNNGEYQSDVTNHWLICEYGGEKLNEAEHEWDEGKVTKAPTCTAEGEKLLTCTVCGHTKTEPIAKKAHTYSTEWTKNATQHWHVCSCGAKSNVANHNWNTGIITKQPTYTATGVKTFTCNTCKATKTATVAKKVLAKVTVSSAANSATGITIKWNNAGNDVSGYKIYRKIGNGGYKLIKTVNNKTFSYNDTGVKNSNGYNCTYAVRAYFGSLQGSYAAKSCVRLTRPTITSATNPASRRLTVKWGRNNKATGYQILYQTGTTKKYVTVKGWSNYYRNINSLVKGKTYYVYVRSYKTVGKTNYYSAWSAYKPVRIAK